MRNRLPAVFSWVLVILASRFVIAASLFVIPASFFVIIPASPFVIPAQAGIQGFRECKGAPRRPFFLKALGSRLRGNDGGYFSNLSSDTRSSLSLAKFMTKSQAMGSCSRSSRLTMTHLVPSITVGMHQGE